MNSNCKSVRALQNTLAKRCCSPGNKPDGRTGLTSDPKLDGPGSGSPAETQATNFASCRISILRWLYDFIDIFWYLLGCKIITTKIKIKINININKDGNPSTKSTRHVEANVNTPKENQNNQNSSDELAKFFI